MVKGISVKFSSFEETIPKILDFVKLSTEIKKYNQIILKPFLSEFAESTPADFVESVLKYCIANKNPVAEVYIAEGADGSDTEDLFSSLGYRELAERYSIGLIDLNTAEVEEVYSDKFTKFESIIYPKILKDSFIISLPSLSENEESLVNGSLSNMLGAYPSEYYSGFFSSKKNKIRKWPIKYSINDIVQCKMPQFAVIDASRKGLILAGQPLEMDKQAAKLIGLDWKNVPYIRLLDEGEEKESKQ